MTVGVQFTGSVGAGATHRWFTYNWSPGKHVVWTVVPTSAQSGAPQIEWEVSVERASATGVTYWITVRNLTAAAVSIEGRYAILN